MLTRLLYRITKFDRKEIRCKGNTFRVFIADSLPRQVLGLMHREGMGKNQGMLLVFKKDRRADIWMLNMRFGIDILWLDGNGDVLKIKKNAEPCASMFNCPVYRSPDNVRYVLELNANTSTKKGIKTGSRFHTLPLKA